ncbi:Uncharacterised protein [Vibrio cholerae]|uniref:Uncharacterized protein n=1 Tax=Vibrio cholerae TaxID=666 RepID=A0A655P053_VIBCL|nr:Uncharacterised protein [Vibrio cholerae]
MTLALSNFAFGPSQDPIRQDITFCCFTPDCLHQAPNVVPLMMNPAFTLL